MYTMHISSKSINNKSLTSINSLDLQITGIDFDKDAYEMGLEFIKNAGVDHKITFIQSDVLQALDKMLSVRDPLHHSCFYNLYALP